MWELPTFDFFILGRFLRPSLLGAPGLLVQGSGVFRVTPVYRVSEGFIGFIGLIGFIGFIGVFELLG